MRPLCRALPGWVGVCGGAKVGRARMEFREDRMRVGLRILHVVAFTSEG
jgi:hypothetical protein